MNNSYFNSIFAKAKDLLRRSKLIAFIRRQQLIIQRKLTENSAIFFRNELNSLSVPIYSTASEPYVFTSALCRAQHFRMPLYSYWCNQLRQQPKLHRKQWEFVYICQSLYERGFLSEDKSGLGFGVGREPLVPLFASRGVRVVASDLDFDNAARLGWVETNQHSNQLTDLNLDGICESQQFSKLVSFKNVDMTDIPSDIGIFDFCWSSCAFEHLGSIQNGMDFVLNSVRLLKPGGIAIHTTEFNLTSESDTLDNNEHFVIFRKKDIELIAERLKKEGFIVEPIDFCPGNDPLDNYVDLPPYKNEPHLRLQLGKFSTTSIGLIVWAPC